MIEEGDKQARSAFLFISLDGVDGVGKSTIADLIVKNNAGSFSKYKRKYGPLASFIPEINIITRSCPILRYAFYKLGTAYDGKEISQNLLPLSSIVADRYIFSLGAYSIALDERIRDVYSEDGIFMPNFSFILVCSSEVRKNRMKARGDYVDEAQQAVLDKVQEEFLRIGREREEGSTKIHVIDTTEHTEEEIVNQILGVIEFHEHET